MDYDQLVDAMSTVQETPRAAGVVLSRKAWMDLKQQASDPIAQPQAKVNEPMAIMGTPLYPFSDVPDTRIWMFRDRDLLTRYLKLRDKIGHTTAIQRLSAEVDEELIIEAELRALLDRS